MLGNKNFEGIAEVRVCKTLARSDRRQRPQVRSARNDHEQGSAFRQTIGETDTARNRDMASGTA